MTTTTNPCAGCSTPADACSWSQNPLEKGGDCCAGCAHDIGCLTFDRIKELRDEALQRLDVANAELAWAQAADALIDDPEYKHCTRCNYRLDPSTGADVHEICIDPTRVEVDPVLAEVARCPDCRGSEIVVVPNEDVDGEPGVYLTVSHDQSCPTLARRLREAS